MTPATFDPSAVLKPSRISPYPYQEAGVRAIVAEFKRGIESTLAVMPTGTGKSYLSAWVSRWAISQGFRSLVIAHREELIQQMANSHVDLGIPVAIEQGDQHARTDSSWLSSIYDEDGTGGQPVCVIASKDTLQKKRLASWDPDYFGLIVTDEAHHAPAATYGNIYKHFNAPRRLFVTATPDRLDGTDLGVIAETIAYQYSIREAITEGWLCRPKFVRCKCEVDLRKFSKRAMKDFSDSDIAEAIRPHIEELANATRQEIGDRPTIVFCPDIMTSEMMAGALTSIGIKAEAVSGVTANRKEMIDGFRGRQYQVLCNAMLLTEGADFPFVSAVVFCRPTMSRALYSQMAGRGLRRGKADCLLIDFTWVTEKHELLVGPTELFDTHDTDSEVMDAARKKVEDGETSDLMEAVERAEAEHRERVKLDIKVRERRVRYERIVYDPFAVMEAVGIPIRQEAPSVSRVMATGPQVETLTRMGIVGAEQMSKRRASMMLEKLFKRREEGLATFKQVSHLTANGVPIEDARAMTKDEATERLDQFWGKSKAS